MSLSKVMTVYLLYFISAKANNMVLGLPISNKELNENSDSTLPSNDLRRQLCPNRTLSFRYHNESAKCYRIDETGPCGLNMIFKTEENSTVYGYCECDFENSTIPLIFHPQKNKCFHLYTKGYCKEGQWLVFNNESQPTCVPNKCQEDTMIQFEEDVQSSYTIIEFGGNCAYLNLNNACKENQTLTFLPGATLASCNNNTMDFSTKIISLSVINTSPLKCRPGSVRNILGRCKRKPTSHLASREDSVI